jgi:ABC-2 type transport system permease protein
MTRALAIAQRELASYFRLPIGWVVIALYLVLTGFVFAFGTLAPGRAATMREFFQLSSWLVLFVAPAVSMRLISEELRAGTIEPLMTAPVSDWEVLIGKHLAGAGFLFAMVAPTLVYVGVLALLAPIDPGPVVAGYAGLLLLGLFYLSAGLFFSALTANQIVAFLSTLFFLLLLRVVSTEGARRVGPPIDKVFYALSVDLRLLDFAKGVIDTSHVVFFLAGSAWFVALAAVALESRRWR